MPTIATPSGSIFKADTGATNSTVVTTTITTTFHNPSRRRRREWQRATQLYRDTKQFCVTGWEHGTLTRSVTTASIENDLYAVLQNQAIREAKADYAADGAVEYRASQPFALNNQSWEIDTTDAGTVVIGFPCISGWWYTPIDVYDDIAADVRRLIDGDAEQSRLQVYRRDDDWYCAFTVEHDTDPDGTTPIGVDIGHNHLLAAYTDAAAESMLVSGREAKYVRRKYRSLRESLQEAGALRARNRVGHKEERRIRDLNHTASRRLIDWADQFDTPVIKLESLDGLRDGADWHGTHRWHFYQLQKFIIYKAERAGMRVELVDPFKTSQRCAVCGTDGQRTGDHFSCHGCGRGRHADLNAAENIAQREGDPCTASQFG